MEHCDVVLRILEHPLDIDRYCTAKLDMLAFRPNQRTKTVEHWTNIFIRRCGEQVKDNVGRTQLVY